MPGVYDWSIFQAQKQYVWFNKQFKRTYNFWLFHLFYFWFVSRAMKPVQLPCSNFQGNLSNAVIDISTTQNSCKWHFIVLKSDCLDFIFYISVSAKFAPIRPPQIHLTRINFEVPHQEKSPVFIGREWLFRKLEKVCLIIDTFIVRHL